MNKEKQIEEINDIISCCWNTISAAKKLYNVGYRKVPDGATVLLVGENNQALDEKTIEYFVKHNEQIRKEAVKEFAKKLKDKVGRNFIGNSLPEIVDELLKEYEK